MHKRRKKTQKISFCSYYILRFSIKTEKPTMRRSAGSDSHRTSSHRLLIQEKKLLQIFLIKTFEKGGWKRGKTENEMNFFFHLGNGKWCVNWKKGFFLFCRQIPKNTAHEMLNWVSVSSTTFIEIFFWLKSEMKNVIRNAIITSRETSYKLAFNQSVTVAWQCVRCCCRRTI